MFLRGWLWVQEPDGRGKKLLLSLSCFAIKAAEALTRWQPSEKTVTRVIWVFDDFVSSASASFDVDVLQRGRADPEIRSAKRTLLCKALQSWPGAVFIPHWDGTETKTFYGPCIESFQDCWWDPEFSQLSQMVQSLPGFLDLCLDVCSPSQVLGDVYRRGTLKRLLSPQGSHWS